MAHERKRHIEQLFYKLIAFSPIVGVFGHRQVGKSTFIANNVKEYRTLDDVDELEKSSNNPKKYIQSIDQTPLAIDECQMEPKLFPTMKEWVRTHKKPGQFVLSGSVRFTSRKLIRESLAGRMSFLEMYPFSVSEIAQEPLSDVVVKLLDQKVFSSDSFLALNHGSKISTLKKHFELFLENGGLPALCFVRNPKIQRNQLNELHDLILGRDLGLVSDLKISVSTVKRFLVHLGKNSFRPYNASEVTRVLGLAPQTQKKLLFALESVFLIRRIPVPLRKKEVILFEDQLEEKYYSDGALDRIRYLESAVYRNVRHQFGYRLDKSAQFEHYLTRDHARVPLVIRHESQCLGIIVIEGELPTLSETRQAASFLKNHSNAKILYLAAEAIKPKVIDERTLLCSIYSVI